MGKTVEIIFIGTIISFIQPVHLVRANWYPWSIFLVNKRRNLTQFGQSITKCVVGEQMGPLLHTGVNEIFLI